ncbi:Hypothetical predicted protein [Octopus vulgaris]|uniref:Uncharacterized protein n=2 Tax=Octopus TaxID=6643 RepID=A0AA36BQ20_OCTVU|nr:uncharacterized protein LOC115222861 isoform X1 [Octopus sinensis]CAI9738466.1 Hypothetical predicted protein [Octopus vulgaris]
MQSPMAFANYTDLTVNSAGLVVTPLGHIPVPYFLQVVTVILIFAVSLSSGFSLWMMFDLWSMFIYGLIQLFFPFVFIPQVEVRVDGVHLFMVRAFGIMLLGSAYLWWNVRNSKDITVHTTLMWARVMGGAAALLAQGFAQFNKASRMTQEHLYISVLLTVLWTLGNLIYCMRSTEWGGYMETRSKLNNFLHTDFVITLIFGIMFYAYPVWLLRVQTSLPRLNVVHAHLYRLFGSALMSSAIISGRASNFLIASDKRVQLYTRVLINVGLIILFLVTYFSTAKHNDWSVPNTPFILGVVGIWTLNAFCGSYSLAYFKN